MAYLTGDLILDNHYNDFTNNGTNNLNKVWGIGTGDYGYGQTNTISPVSPGNTVTATQWSTFLDRVQSSGAHQGTGVSAYTGPTTGNIIDALQTITTDVDSITTNRTTMAGALVDQAATTASSSGSGTWTSSTVHTFNINFTGGNEARHFFNCGGEIWFTVTSNAEGGGNAKENDWENTLETDVATVKMAANTTTRTGSGTINASLPGYYGLTANNTDQIIMKVFSNSSTNPDFNNPGVDAYGAINYYQIQCNPGLEHSDALGNKGNSLKFTISLIDAAADDVDPTPGDPTGGSDATLDQIDSLFTSTIVIKKPNTTNLFNTPWGTIGDTFTSFTQT